MLRAALPLRGGRYFLGASASGSSSWRALAAATAPRRHIHSLHLRASSSSATSTTTCSSSSSARAFGSKAPYYERNVGEDGPAPQLPQHWEARVQVWEAEKARQQAEQAALPPQPDTPITVTVGSKSFPALGGVTTPLTLHEGKLLGDALCVLVDGVATDLSLPLPRRDCELEFVGYDHPKGSEALWHSAAHVLGQALEFHYGNQKVMLHDGPAKEEGGFYYDALIAEHDAPAGARGTAVTSDDLKSLSKLCDAITGDKQPFERLVLSRDVARQLFKDNAFKQAILDRLDETEVVTAYRCGPLIDLCRGPHIPHTGRIRAMEVVSCAGNVVKQGDADAPLQRVSGVAFADRGQLKAWRKLIEEAAKRDHRLLGKQQELFMFHEYSPGSAFMLPHGTRIYNTLVAFLRKEYRERGYHEVRTPLLYDPKLWKISGHWENYRENMFIVKGGNSTEAQTQALAQAQVQMEEPLERDCCGGAHAEQDAEQESYGLKPMNCPGHCLVFASRTRSYRELPMRLADFSTLHRNEISGALTGLTRVRRFAQDDAHIFCTEQQMADEIKACLMFVADVYKWFGFEFRLTLSTRPEKYVGSVEVWDRAEDALRQCLDEFGGSWTVNAGDGAFYGPKVDVCVKDALGREHQCATIQLDFQLPLRFGLKYRSAEAVTDEAGAEGEAAGGAASLERTPVMIHRAILGSVERMMAVLLEHYGGKWPLWLSPRQVSVVPVTKAHTEYAEQVAATLRARGLFVDVAEGSHTLNKKVRAAQVAQYNYILVAGDAEMEGGSVNVRTRDGKVHGVQLVDECADMLLAEVESKGL